MNNIHRLRTMYEQFNARNLDAVLAQSSEQAVMTDHGRGLMIEGRERLAEWLRAFIAMSSDMMIVDTVYVDGGPYVTAMFRVVGTQDGPMDTPMGSFAPTGRQYSLDVCEVWRFDAEGVGVEGHGGLNRWKHLSWPGGR
jgi:hypothetical protein